MERTPPRWYPSTRPHTSATLNPDIWGPCIWDDVSLTRLARESEWDRYYGGPGKDTWHELSQSRSLLELHFADIQYVRFFDLDKNHIAEAEGRVVPLPGIRRKAHVDTMQKLRGSLVRTPWDA
eukprot:Rmarinus@m.21146